MPVKKTPASKRTTRRSGTSPSTMSGEFVREEFAKVGRGKRRARSHKQAVAIGLSKARRAGTAVPAPKKGKASATTRRKATRDVATSKSTAKPRASTRSSAMAGRKASSTGTRSASTRSAAKSPARASKGGRSSARAVKKTGGLARRRTVKRRG